VDDLLLDLNMMIVFVVRALEIPLRRKHFHRILCLYDCLPDVQTHRDNFKAASNKDTESQRDNSLFDSGSESAREGFATKSCVEIFRFDWTGV